MYKQILIDSKFTTGREVKKTKLVGERSHWTVVLPKKKKKTHWRIHSIFIIYLNDQVIIYTRVFSWTEKAVTTNIFYSIN
jgi:hypothetical protein